MRRHCHPAPFQTRRLVVGGIATLVVLVALVTWHGSTPNQHVKRDVFLLLVDTLRADHLSLYGYSRRTSPHLERFAQSAIVFRDVFAAAPWTLPSVASVMTSTYPSVHGLRAKVGSGTLTTIRPSVTTLAETLRTNGYRTVAIITNPWMLTDEHGLRRGFEDYRTVSMRNAPKVNEIARQLLESDEDQRPLFVYMHYMDPHGPYSRHPRTDAAVLGPLPAGVDRPLTPAEFRLMPRYLRLHGESNFGSYVDAYDRAISAWDEAFGKWIDWMDEHHRLDDTLIVVTADHGEEFLDHGRWNHGETLYQEQLGVPWVMRVPGERARWIEDRPVSLIDVAPTILAAIGMTAPHTMMGRNVLDDAAEAQRPLFAETEVRIGGVADPKFSLRTVRQGEKKLIVKPHHRECYDLRTDPGEKIRIDGDSDCTGRLSGDLEAWAMENRRLAAALGSSTEVKLGPSDQERLRALGYLE